MIACMEWNPVVFCPEHRLGCGYIGEDPDHRIRRWCHPGQNSSAQQGKCGTAALGCSEPDEGGWPTFSVVVNYLGSRIVTGW